jgi:hypothetical protein
MSSDQSKTNEALVMEALSTEAFILVNKKLMRFFKGDATAAVFLSELISSYKYHLQTQSIAPDGSFPIPTKRYENALGLTNYKQDRVLTEMEAKQLVDTRLAGFPATKYAKLNFDNIAYIIEHDELKIKKLDQAAFYAEINRQANKLDSYTTRRKQLEDAFDNIGTNHRGVITLLSRRCTEHKRKVEWTGQTFGQIKLWVNRRSTQKAFDFSIVERTLDAMHLLPNTPFHKFISDYILTAKGVQDAHYLAQVHDYNDLIPQVPQELV